MFRKAFMGLGLLALGSYLWFGTSVGSYTRTGLDKAQSFAKGQVPVEFEIDHARRLVKELVPDIRKTKQTIAEEEVRIDRLKREIAQVEKNLDSEKVAILTLRDQLDKGLASYKIGGQTYSAENLKADLNRRFTSFRHADTTLKAKRDILTSRETSLGAVRQQYERLNESKQQLEAELAGLEAKHKLIEARKVSNKFQIDDSQLSKLRQSIEAINDRLAVEDKMAAEEGNLDKRVPVEQIPVTDLGNQIDSYFGEKPQPASTGKTAL